MLIICPLHKQKKKGFQHAVKTLLRSFSPSSELVRTKATVDKNLKNLGHITRNLYKMFLQLTVLNEANAESQTHSRDS